jgi:hypothetical protein
MCSPECGFGSIQRGVNPEYSKNFLSVICNQVRIVRGSAAKIGSAEALLVFVDNPKEAFVDLFIQEFAMRSAAATNIILIRQPTFEIIKSTKNNGD